MLNTVLELLGVAMVAGFMLIAWPPLLLLLAGLVLIVAANRPTRRADA